MGLSYYLGEHFERHHGNDGGDAVGESHFPCDFLLLGGAEGRPFDDLEGGGGALGGQRFGLTFADGFDSVLG